MPQKPSTVDRFIHLARSVPARHMVNGRESFRMVIAAKYGDEIPNEIFLHQRSLVDPLNQAEYTDEFCAVCSAFDLSVYPANNPSPTQSPAFFRKAYVDVYLPSESVAMDFWNTVYGEVQVLVNSLNKLDQMKTDLLVWVPYPPPHSESSVLVRSQDSI